MSYMLLILEPRGQRAARDDAQGRAAYARMVEFSQGLKARGLLIGAEALKREELRLRGEGGRVHLFDGPFTESKELIGGFFLVSCATRAEALAIARECPAIEWASIEVRELGTCYE